MVWLQLYKISLVFLYGFTFCHFIRQYPRLCVVAYEYFVFLGRVINPSAKPPFLVNQFISLSLASLLRTVRLGRPYQEHKVLAGIDYKVIEAHKLPPPPPQNDKLETIGEEKTTKYKM